MRHEVVQEVVDVDVHVVVTEEQRQVLVDVTCVRHDVIHVMVDVVLHVVDIDVVWQVLVDTSIVIVVQVPSVVIVVGIPTHSKILVALNITLYTKDTTNDV